MATAEELSRIVKIKDFNARVSCLRGYISLKPGYVRDQKENAHVSTAAKLKSKRYIYSRMALKPQSGLN